MPATPIQSPAAYVPSRAAAYADLDGTSILVSTGNPLPVTMTNAATVPLNASVTVSSLAGPFAPAIGRPIMLTLSGTWTGLVKVLRSTDGGTNKVALTVAGAAWAQFSANCCEPVWEENEAAAALYLDVALTSGTLAYRIA